MINKFIILTSIICLSACLYQKEIDGSYDTSIKQEDNCQFQLYQSLSGVPQSTRYFLNQKNVKNIYFINGNIIDKNKDGLVDENSLRTYIRKIIKSRTASDIGVLDWEGKAIHSLEKDPYNSDNFRKTEKQYIKAYMIAKQEAPHVDWGFYGLPFRDYWNRNEKWKQSNQKLSRILEKTDVIFPSVYDFYVSHHSSGLESRDSLYVSDNIKEALKFGQRFNKKVIPFYWHRYHDSNKKAGMQLIPWEEFENHLTAGIEASYKDKYIDGVIWWGSDKYFYNIGNKGIVNEVGKFRSFEEYQDHVTRRYTTNILQLLSTYCE